MQTGRKGILKNRRGMQCVLSPTTPWAKGDPSLSPRALIDAGWIGQVWSTKAIILSEVAKPLPLFFEILAIRIEVTAQVWQQR